MKKSELKQLIREEIESGLMLRKILKWLETSNGFSDAELDGLRYGEVAEYEASEVPLSILDYLKNTDRLDFDINGEKGYVIYYVPRSNQVWFENVLQ